MPPACGCIADMAFTNDVVEQPRAARTGRRTRGVSLTVVCWHPLLIPVLAGLSSHEYVAICHLKWWLGSGTHLLMISIGLKTFQW